MKELSKFMQIVDSVPGVLIFGPGLVLTPPGSPGSCPGQGGALCTGWSSSHMAW